MRKLICGLIVFSGIIAYALQANACPQELRVRDCGGRRDRIRVRLVREPRPERIVRERIVREPVCQERIIREQVVEDYGCSCAGASEFRVQRFRSGY